MSEDDEEYFRMLKESLLEARDFAQRIYDIDGTDGMLFLDLIVACHNAGFDEGLCK